MRSGYDGLFEASLFGCQVILSIKRGLFWAMLWSLSNFLETGSVETSLQEMKDVQVI